MRTQIALWLVAATSMIVALSSQAQAVVIEQQVSPAFLKENPKNFSVRTTKQEDGRVEFTITRNLARPTYLVASFQVRQGGKLVTECRHASYGLEDVETYSMTVSADQVAESVFELSERSFGSAGSQKVPLPGGVDYVIRLQDFLADVNGR